jgi:hypothetical protein
MKCRQIFEAGQGQCAFGNNTFLYSTLGILIAEISIEMP